MTTTRLVEHLENMHQEAIEKKDWVKCQELALTLWYINECYFREMETIGVNQ